MDNNLNCVGGVSLDEYKVAAALRKQGIPVIRVDEWDEDVDAGIKITDRLYLQIPLVGGISISEWNQEQSGVSHLADGLSVVETIDFLKRRLK